MRPVRRVREEQHIMRMQELRDRRQLCCHAVIRRIDEECRARLGVFPHGILHRPDRYAHRNAEAHIDLRLQPDGPHPRENHRTDDGPVRIARHEEHIAGRKRRHQHSMNRARRPVHHEICRIRTVRLCRQFLRRADTARRRMEIVEF